MAERRLIIIPLTIPSVGIAMAAWFAYGEHSRDSHAVEFEPLLIEVSRAWHVIALLYPAISCIRKCAIT